MKLDTIIATTDKKTIYKDDDLAIKVFDEEFSKADILNEALNLARVEETGLLIPGVQSVTMIDGKWAIATPYIEGKTLEQRIKENPEKMQDYIGLFVHIQLEIHGMTSPNLSKLKDKMERKIHESSIDATTRYDLHTRLESMPKHKKLLHGDFHPSNLICKEDGSVHIIDWAHATQGNAGADVARTYLLFKLQGEDEMAEYYLNYYCKVTDTAKQYVQKWLPIVAASQLVKGKPEEKEFLESWIGVVEYE